MPKRFGPDGGSSLSAPVRVRRAGGLPSQSGAENKAKQFEGKCIDAYGFRTRPHAFHDFNQSPDLIIKEISLFDNVAEANEIVVTDTKISRGSIMMERGATLVSVQFLGEDALAAHDTNYVTFALTNNGPAGSGTTAMLAASDANTTKATGGTAITAEIGRSCTVHGTAANLVVAPGDLLTFTATVAGTLANEVHTPKVRLVFQTIPFSLVPRVSRVAGSPGINYRADVANGWLRATVEATNEAQFVGFDFGDQRTFQANRPWEFEAFVSLPAALTADETFICGVASDYNATLDSITRFAWFRISGAASNLTLKIEADDGSVDLTTTTTYALTAGTAALLRIRSKETGVVEFWVNDNKIGEQTGITWDTTTLQPIFGIGKATGTTTPSADIDLYYFDADRF